MRIHRDERGQTIILVALSLPLLLGFIGIATDVGALFKDKRTLQTAADAAAVAGALNLNYGSAAITAAADKAAARAAATANGFTDTSNGVVVTTPDTPQWPASNYNGKTGYVEVTITKPESTIFLSLFGYPSVTVLARAVATNGPGGGSIYTLAPSLPGALSVNGNLIVQGGGIIVDSSDSNAMTVTGSVTASSTGIVGGCSTCSGTNVIPNAVSAIIPYSDPLSFLPQIAPSGSCTNALNATGGTAIIFPGCYGTFKETGANVTLNPGMYIINDPSMNFTGGNVTGTGVTLYMTTGGLAINNTTLNLSAPNDRSQPFNGILFAQSSLDNTAASINGLPSSTLQGLFYFPAANITLVGSTNGTFYTGFVAQSLTMTLSPGFTFNNYALLPGVTSPITSATLVE